MARAFAPAGYLSSSAGVGSLLSAAAGTVACWALLTGTAPSGNPNNGRTFFGDNSNAEFGLFQTLNAGVTAVWAALNSGGWKSTSATYTANVWTHWAWVHTGGTLFLYKNGALANSVAAGNQVTGGTFQIGYGGGSSNYFQGSMAEMGVWNVGLSAEGIAGLARGRSPRQLRPGSLTAYWPLWGLSNPEPDMNTGSFQLTPTGNVTPANHAPVVPFSSRVWGNAPRIDVPAPGTAKSRRQLSERVGTRTPLWF